MPPNSTSLLQEGAQFVSFKIVEKGQFKEKGKHITELTKNTLLIFFFLFKKW
jgi:N-methylhydantoinase B/oxoprolinase/acetone carboxylase alpha subunit